MHTTVVSPCPDQPIGARDPVAAFFADPDSHLADTLYLYFRAYESMRRGGGHKTPALLALYFTTGFFVSMLPARLGRFFGDTTVLQLRKP